MYVVSKLQVYLLGIYFSNKNRDLKNLQILHHHFQSFTNNSSHSFPLHQSSPWSSHKTQVGSFTDGFITLHTGFPRLPLDGISFSALCSIFHPAGIVSWRPLR
uniref:Uncharacterized protein n=1 Tax=Cacopsylla melanoneura TaxID=428564 RepID=A0A8D8TGZ9_9HEMI